MQIKSTILALILSITINSYANTTTATKKCDILIVGGGIGGVASALQACEMAEQYDIKKIIITEYTDWLGGQYTSQGVTATDGNEATETGHYEVGASNLYYTFHETIRDFYRPLALKTAQTTSRTGNTNSKARQMDLERIQSARFSPGTPWADRMSFLPEDGVKAIDILISPYIKKGLLEVIYEVKPIDVFKDKNKIIGVKLKNIKSNKELIIKSRFTIDATELGDLLPLSNTEYSIGIEESMSTGEPTHFTDDGTPLYPKAVPGCVQSITFPFAIEWRPEGEDHRLPWESRPEIYEKYRHRYYMRPFLMAKENEHDNSLKKWPGPCFWTYRRMYDAMNFNPDLQPDLYTHYKDGKWIEEFSPETTPEYFIPNSYNTNVGDIIEVNWAAHDFTCKSIIDIPETEREEIYKEAKLLSICYLYWLWYECPRDPVDPTLDPNNEDFWDINPVTGKNRGYPNLKFRPEIMGTQDGLSKHPYIRESRRIKALKTIVQHEIMGHHRERAQLFHDAVGIGHYFMDIHPCDMGCEQKLDVQYKNGEQHAALFQVPFGALVPQKTDNLLPAAKNIGTTHITNAAYRLHPLEFNIGQVSGATAVLCLKWDCQPRDIFVDTPSIEPSSSEKKLRQLQYELLKRKTPIFWNFDCGWETKNFIPIQFACALDIMQPRDINFQPDKLLTRKEAVIAAARIADGIPFDEDLFRRYRDITKPDDTYLLGQALAFLESRHALAWAREKNFMPEKAVTRAQFKFMLAKALGQKSDINETKTQNAENLTRSETAKILFEIIKNRYQLK